MGDAYRSPRSELETRPAMISPISDSGRQIRNAACPTLSEPSNGASRTLAAALALPLADKNSAKDGLNE